jgi:hypothetical protein
VALLREAARLQAVEHELRDEVGALLAELERGRTLWFRAKRRLVRSAGHNRAAAAGLAVYRRVRGSSSRSA